MLVDTENPPESKPEAPAPAPAHSHLRVRSDLHEEYSSDEIAKMTELYEGTLSNIEEGEIVKSKVLRVTDTAVILDVGFKSEGAVPIDEFKDAKTLKEGDEVEVFLEHLEDQEGAVVLSKKKADFMRVWERIREAHEGDEPVSGTLVKKIKGGVVVDLMGVDAFLPGSQIALRRVPNIDELLGQSFDFKIIKLNKRRRNIVVSRRVLLEAERFVLRSASSSTRRETTMLRRRLLSLMILKSKLCPRSSSMLGTRRSAIWLPGRNASTPIRSTTTPPLIFFTSVPETGSSFS